MNADAAQTAVRVVLEELEQRGLVRFISLVGPATLQIITERVENIHVPCGREMREGETCYCDRDD